MFWQNLQMLTIFLATLSFRGLACTTSKNWSKNSSPQESEEDSVKCVCVFFCENKEKMCCVMSWLNKNPKIKIQKSRSKNPKIKIQKWLPRHPCPHILVPGMNLSSPYRVDRHPLNLNSHRLWQISRVLLLFDEKSTTHMVPHHNVENFMNFYHSDFYVKSILWILETANFQNSRPLKLSKKSFLIF